MFQWIKNWLFAPPAPPPKANVGISTVTITLKDGMVYQRTVTGSWIDTAVGPMIHDSSTAAGLAVGQWWRKGPLFEVEKGLYLPYERIEKIQITRENHFAAEGA